MANPLSGETILNRSSENDISKGLANRPRHFGRGHAAGDRYRRFCDPVSEVLYEQSKILPSPLWQLQNINSYRVCSKLVRPHAPNPGGTCTRRYHTFSETHPWIGFYHRHYDDIAGLTVSHRKPSAAVLSNYNIWNMRFGTNIFYRRRQTTEEPYNTGSSKPMHPIFGRAIDDTFVCLPPIVERFLVEDCLDFLYTLDIPNPVTRVLIDRASIRYETIDGLFAGLRWHRANHEIGNFLSEVISCKAITYEAIADYGVVYSPHRVLEYIYIIHGLKDEGGGGAWVANDYVEQLENVCTSIGGFSEISMLHCYASMLAFAIFAQNNSLHIMRPCYRLGSEDDFMLFFQTLADHLYVMTPKVTTNLAMYPSRWAGVLSMLVSTKFCQDWFRKMFFSSIEGILKIIPAEEIAYWVTPCTQVELRIWEHYSVLGAPKEVEGFAKVKYDRFKGRPQVWRILQRKNTQYKVLEGQDKMLATDMADCCDLLEERILREIGVLESQKLVKFTTEIQRHLPLAPSMYNSIKVYNRLYRSLLYLSRIAWADRVVAQMGGCKFLDDVKHITTKKKKHMKSEDELKFERKIKERDLERQKGRDRKLHQATKLSPKAPIKPQVGFNVKHKVDPKSFGELLDIPSISTMIDNATAMTNSVADMAAELKRLGEAELYNKLANMADNISQVSTSGTKVFDGLTLIGQILKACVTVVVPIVAGVYLLTRKDLMSRMGGSAAILCGLKLICPDDELWQFILPFIPRNEIVAQSSLPVEALAKVATACMGWCAIGGRNWREISSSAMQTISRVPNTVRGSEDVVKMIAQGFETIVNFVRKRFGHDSIHIDTTGFAQLKAWAGAVLKFHDDVASGKISVDVVNVDSLLALQQEGQHLEETFKFNKAVLPEITATRRQLDTLRHRFASAVNMRGGERQEPVTIFLYSEPGKGKSYLCPILATEVLTRVLPPERLAAMGYRPMNDTFVQPQSEYYNGYANQTMYVMDDFGQHKATSGDEENDYMRLIRLANCWRLPLNMADLESKGTTFFRSKLILLTTNVKNIHDEAQKYVYDPIAVARRLNIPYKVEVKPRFMDRHGRVNRVAVSEYLAENPVHRKTDIWEFHRLVNSEFKDMTTGGEPISFDQLVAEIIARYDDNRIDHEDNMNASHARCLEILGQNNIVPQAGPEKKPPTNLIAKAINVASHPLVLVPTFLYTVGQCMDPKELPIDYSDLVERVGDFSDLPHCYHVEEVVRNGVRLTVSYLYKQPDKYVIFGHNAAMRLLSKIKVGFFTYERFMDSLSTQNPMMGAITRASTWYLYFICVVSLIKGLAHIVENVVPRWMSPKPVSEVAYRKLSHKPKKVQEIAAELAELVTKDDCGDEVIITPELLDKMRGRLKSLQAGSPRKAALAANLACDIENAKLHSLERHAENIVHDKESDSMVVIHPHLQQQSGACNNKTDVAGVHLMRKALVNMFQIAVYNGPEHIDLLGYGMMVFQNWMLIPYHFIPILKGRLAGGAYHENFEISFRNVAQDDDKHTRMPIRHFIKCFLRPKSMSNTDAGIVQLPHMQSYRDLECHFLTEKECSLDSHIPVCLSVPKTSVMRPDSLTLWNHCTVATTMKKLHYSGDDNKRIEVAWAMQYTLPTIEGDCGAPLFHLNGKAFQGRRLIGIHVAGDGQSAGFAAIITREMIVNAKEEVKATSQQEPPMPIYQQGGAMHVRGSFVPLYTVPGGSGFADTGIVKTPLHNTYKASTVAPARLKPFELDGERVYPMDNAIKKYSTPTKYLDPEILEVVEDVLYNKVCQATHGFARQIRTFEEAVRGVEGGAMDCRGIPRSTSAGWPLCDKYHNGKTDIFGAKDDYDFTLPGAIEVRKMVDEAIGLMKEGVRPFFVYKDFLKDETLDLSKVAIGKTRLISAAPLVYVIICRMYCIDFTVAIMKSMIENGCCVGINCYSKDWSVLEKYLTKFSMEQIFAKLIAGDYSGFDTNEVPQLHRVILNVMNRWYNDGLENQRIREIIWLEVTASRHINGSVIYQWRKSLPSGHPMTTIINSLYNLGLMIGCYILAHNRQLESAWHFFRHVSPEVYGDDNAAGVSDEKVDIYNQNTLVRLMEEFGQVYTNETKSGIGPDYRNINEISFLKRRFRHDPLVPYTLAPLELKSILELPMWCSDKTRVTEIMHTNIERALMELSAHEQETWDLWFPAIREAAINVVGYYPKRSNRASYLLAFQNYKPPY